MEMHYQTIIDELDRRTLQDFQCFYNWILELHSLSVGEIPVKRANLITIDGMAGAGKDTYIQALCSKYPDIVSFREDDYDPFHHYVRHYWNRHFNQADDIIPVMLIAAGKRYVNENQLAMKMSEKRIVVTNRSFLSTIAYSHLPLEDLLEIYSHFPYAPDTRIILICKPEIARQRALHRGKNGKTVSLEFLLRSYTAFLKLQKFFPDGKIIDTSNMTRKDMFIQITNNILHEDTIKKR